MDSNPATCANRGLKYLNIEFAVLDMDGRPLPGYQYDTGSGGVKYIAGGHEACVDSRANCGEYCVRCGNPIHYPNTDSNIFAPVSVTVAFVGESGQICGACATVRQCGVRGCVLRILECEVYCSKHLCDLPGCADPTMEGCTHCLSHSDR